MHRRHPLPRIWLMTDPRGGDPVAILRRQRTRIGVIVRHYELRSRERRALFRRVRRAAAGKHLVLLAAPPVMAAAWGAQGAHDRSARCSRGLRTVAVHSLAERALATRSKADLIFVSPVFTTRSHPGGRGIGPRTAALIAGPLRRKTILLGGMNAARSRQLAAVRHYGWAAIDAFRI